MSTIPSIWYISAIIFNTAGVIAFLLTVAAIIHHQIKKWRNRKTFSAFAKAHDDKYHSKGSR